MKRILIVKLWALGDILMATPLLRALKTKYPQCSISWIVDTRYVGALENNLLLDEVIPFDSSPWRRDFRYGRLYQYLTTSFSIYSELKKRNFDLVVSLTPDKWWCLWFKAGRESIGLFPSDRPGRLGKLYDHVVTLPPGKKDHNTDHYLRPMHILGSEGPHDRRIVYTVAAEDRRVCTKFLSQAPKFDPSKPYAVLHPGTSQKTKCWLPENFAALADLLIPTMQVVISGSPDEAELAEQILRLCHRPDQIVVSAGRLTRFGESAALVEGAALVVTGDTSILHISSALDTPMIAVYGSTRPNDNAPLFGQNILLWTETLSCSPCYKASCSKSGAGYLACQRAITPEMVYAHAKRLLSKPVDPPIAAIAD